jgi:IMP dehydrogenase
MVHVLEDFPLALSFDDVLLVPQYSEVNSRTEVDLTSKISPNLTLKMPIISTKMDTVTGVEMAIAMGKAGGLGIIPRFDPIDVQAGKVAKVKKSGVVVAAAIGIKEGYMERAEALVKAGATVLDVDVAHGHMKKTIEVTKAIRNRFGNNIALFSGIAATKRCADDLYNAGADAILVGIGGSPICSTRIVTGCGLPVFASLLEISEVARRHKKTFFPDAGIRHSGDIVKSFAAGASAVVCGYLLAGVDENPGQMVEIKGRKYKTYNGSASQEEKKKHVEKDPGDKGHNYTIQVEGITSLVNYQGPVREYLNGILAGVRSGFSYCGARNIKELWETARFVRVTNSGIIENGAHDVLVTEKE